ncbi:MAG: DsrE family protein [Candidatus Auribacterota bacterium]|nr:DsrE family protein [Candidatus Auribacterota bacterium]
MEAKTANPEARVMIVIASGEKEKAWTGLLYARWAVGSGYLDSTRIFLWGPAAELVIRDMELKAMAEEIINLGEIIYVCKACSDKYGVSGELEKIGCRVEYVGPVSTEFIRQGYTVFNW